MQIDQSGCIHIGSSHARHNLIDPSIYSIILLPSGNCFKAVGSKHAGIQNSRKYNRQLKPHSHFQCCEAPILGIPAVDLQ